MIPNDFIKEIEEGRTDFRNEKFTNMIIFGLDIVKCNFQLAVFQNCTFVGCNIIEGDFTGVFIEKSKFSFCRFMSSKFEHCDIHTTTLEGNYYDNICIDNATWTDIYSCNAYVRNSRIGDSQFSRCTVNKLGVHRSNIICNKLENINAVGLQSEHNALQCNSYNDFNEF